MTHLCGHCKHGILDYSYGVWWICRDCGTWHAIVPTWTSLVVAGIEHGLIVGAVGQLQISDVQPTTVTFVVTSDNTLTLKRG